MCQLIILDHIAALCNEQSKRIYFLRHLLRSFGVRKQSILLSVIMSVLQYLNSIWYISVSVMLKTKLFKSITNCSRIVGQPLEKLYDSYAIYE